MKIITLALLLLGTAVGAAAAQTTAEFPIRPVKLLVPFAAGGPTDVVARILADFLTARWNGQSVVIENRPGARSWRPRPSPSRRPTATPCSSPPIPC